MKRRPFSLIELMVAMALLALVGGAIIFNMRKGYVDRQQKDSLERIQSTLKLASRLSKITHNEVRVVFFDEDGKKMMQIHSDVAGSTFMKTALSRKQPLEQVQEVSSTPKNLYDDAVEVSYFPWGYDQSDYSLEVQFSSGKKVLCDPKLYVPQDGQVAPREHIDLFPQEVLQDDEEKKLIHAD